MYLYSPTIIVTGIAVGTPKIAQISFGLSISSIAAMAASQISNTCSQDWIEVNSKSTHSILTVHCKCLQGITGTLRGNQSGGISNLWGLHVYPQPL